MMLPEPEFSLVQSWIAAGNVIQIVPFGISGKVWCFAVTARRSGMWGSFKRFGGKHIAREALVYIATGQLSVAQARVGVVWDLLRDKGPLQQSEIERALEMDHSATRKAVLALLDTGAAERMAQGRMLKFQAIGERAPHWASFLRAQARAA